MKAMILAAGLGTRLKPWTLTHPKALVPVGGVAMLERIIRKLEKEGFREIIVNVHHFGEQIIEFLDAREWDANISVSDERGALLDTGGGILHAASLLTRNDSPALIHNVDILSSADLGGFVRTHQEKGNDVTFLVSDRKSSRKLIFDGSDALMGWHNLTTGELRRSGAATDDQWRRIEKAATAGLPVADDEFNEHSFSGISVLDVTGVIPLMNEVMENSIFPVMDFFLSRRNQLKQRCHLDNSLQLIDIGKPETLAEAGSMLEMIEKVSGF